MHERRKGVSSAAVIWYRVLFRQNRTDRPMALLSGEEWIQRMWGKLYFSVKTGEIAFDHVFGREFFGFLSIPENSQASRICAEQLESRTAKAADAVMAAYDFSPFDKVVHVGGGYGSLLLAILKAHRTLKGILFDLPHVIDEAVKPGHDRRGSRTL